MTERPILFTPENAQKCHDGTKTQTRRIVKLPLRCPAHGVVLNSIEPRDERDGDLLANCPYGVPGDRLWVREAFCIHPMTGSYWYKGEGRTDVTVVLKWKPSLHMPRWACRTVLEITEIRVHRLQEISEEDAEAEGCVAKVSFHESKTVLAREAFCLLWDSINGAGSWDANPWVWCVSFKKVDL